MKRQYVIVLLLLFLLAPLAHAQDEKSDEEKEEARLLKKARRLVEDGEKEEAWKLYSQLVGLARQREHNRTAITALDESRAVAPSEEEEGHVCDTLGHLELREGEHASSNKHYARAAKLLPNDARIWNNYAYSLHLVGRDDKAVEAYERCIELDPGYNLAKVSLGESSRLAGDAQKALKIHSKLVAKAREGDIVGPNTGSWYWSFESALSKAKQKGAAFDNGEQRRALVELQVVVDHAFLDDLGAAEEAIDEARKKIGAEDLLPAVEKALDDLNRALELRQAHFQLHYVAGLLHEAKGDKPSAKAAFEKFIEAEKATRSFAKKAKEKVEASK